MFVEIQVGRHPSRPVDSGLAETDSGARSYLVAIRADFAGVVVSLSTVASKAKRSRIGLGALGTLGVTIRAIRLMHIGIVCIRGRNGVASGARGGGGMMRVVTLRTI